MKKAAQMRLPCLYMWMVGGPLSLFFQTQNGFNPGIMMSDVNFKVRILLILFAQVITSKKTPQDECFVKFRVLNRDALTLQNIGYIDKLTV